MGSMMDASGSSSQAASADGTLPAHTASSSSGASYSAGCGFGLGSSSYAMKKDKLNLSGILNVLDGVVDTPDRIIVMTTNHPELLDPALIRPGRIDLKLLLGYMKVDHIVEMINHYFQLENSGGLQSKLVARLKHAVAGNEALGIPPLQLTPAHVEQLSAEHDHVGDL